MIPRSDASPQGRIVRLYGAIFDRFDRREIETVNRDSERFLAETIFESLIMLGNMNSAPVNILINNAGGSIKAGLMIVHAIEHLQAKHINVEMFVIGSSMSMASIILASGTEGKRYATARSIVHFHSARMTFPKDMELDEQEKERLKAEGNRQALELRRILAVRTHIPEYWRSKSLDSMNTESVIGEEARLKWVREFLDDERHLSAEEAREAGVIDEVLYPGDPRLDNIFKNLEKGGAE